ncbi:hypothetical protein Har1130_03665 [Haloarcula sp. CBA1130]|uniref:hypothetical protein n=1 Tax=unclassified Haloarcula TaxID=2624677 RepID=UPI001246A165|nr:MULTISPECIES: hypothetical protein [unclassified Haloarcula]KAA9398524.1 hypothetical protein Har1129_09990 [Haloarcula sp. CBA1129]KAA9401884.1 hypothetical protein Har1130_03665 [Haloarcula sp. CBA1130]
MSIIQRNQKEQNDSDGESTRKRLSYGRIKTDLKRGYRRAKQIIKSYFLLIFILFTGVFGILEAVGLNSGVPEHMVPYSVYWSYGVYVGLVPAELLRQYVSDDTRERLYAYNAKASKLAKWAIPSQLIHKIDFRNPDGEPMDWDDVDQIHTAEHGLAYLVTDFDKESMEAEVTWLAGKNQIDLRAEKEQLNEAVTVTWKMAESAIQVLSQRENISREAALKEIQTNIENRENINLESDTRQTDIESVLKDNDVLQDDIIQDIQEEIGGGDDE